MPLKFLPIKTKKFLPPQDSIFPALEKSLPKLKEGDVLFITSKILSIHQGRSVKIQNLKSKVQKTRLIYKEADYILPLKNSPHGIIFTIKENTLIPTAGIDESNANGYYLLWPKTPSLAAKKICFFLKKKFRLKKLAVVVTDSHTTPLRWGTQGICIGLFGLEPLRDYRGKRDIFGRKLQFTQSNIVDSLTAAAVLLMGEGAEQTPMVILRDAKFLKFTNKETFKQLAINPKQDLYYPLLKVFRKRKKL